MDRSNPSIGDALERTYEAGQSLLVQRIDLLVAESKLLVRNSGRFLLCGIVALTGWLLLVQGLIEAFAQRYPRFAVELAASVVHFGLAVFIALRTRGPEDG